MRDPDTGMVDEGYREVTPAEYMTYKAAYPAPLGFRVDDALGAAGWEDPAVGPYPEGLVAFISYRTGRCYVRDGPT